ncbi:hypothetical protein EMGBS3_08740 [Anaerolineaceae bacterium]|nr:hypothetical protein EMGBS3_08740 [Anaerolineaceae bacterium]
MDPRALAALARRAMLLRQLGSLPAALADFDSALLLAPDNVELLVERGSTHSLSGEYQLAIADFNNALAANRTRCWRTTGAAWRATASSSIAMRCWTLTPL